MINELTKTTKPTFSTQIAIPTNFKSLDQKLSLQPVSMKNVKRIIQELPMSSASGFDDIRVNVLRKSLPAV